MAGGGSFVKEEPQSPSDPHAASNHLLSGLFSPNSGYLVKDEPSDVSLAGLVTTTTSTASEAAASTTVPKHIHIPPLQPASAIFKPSLVLTNTTTSSRLRASVAAPTGAGGHHHHRLVFPKVNLKLESESRCGFTNTTVQSGHHIETPAHRSSVAAIIRSSASAASPALYRTNSSVSTTTKVVFGHPTPSTRHPIQTSLISSQPKGATGILHLTEEEKRTLISEGYPVPQRLPLSKSEEKSLKKIRRKIKNKISAQESRRKKKEYMDCLERKMQGLNNDLESFKQKCSSLDNQNMSLRAQVQQLQAQLANKSGIKEPNVRGGHLGTRSN
jgi:hypothetical protein